VTDTKVAGNPKTEVAISKQTGNKSILRTAKIYEIIIIIIIIIDMEMIMWHGT